MQTKCVVQMERDQTFLYHPGEDKQPKIFAFDHCFESSDPQSHKFASKSYCYNTRDTVNLMN